MDNTQLHSSFPLQRGSACLSCRKRKMKCDAGKPVCGQCIKAKRSTSCDYVDGKSRTCTQVLQDKICTLEQRIHELEATPRLQRFHSTSTDSSTHRSKGLVGEECGGSFVDCDLATFSVTGSLSPVSPPESVWVGDQRDLQLGSHLSSKPDELPWDVDTLPMNSAPMTPPMTPTDLIKASGRWWEADVPPQHIERLLIDVFLLHRHQCGFEVNVDRFRASVNSTDPPHAALLNAIYALACHFSPCPLLSPHEPRFTARAQHAISHALEASDRLVHVIQASCLIATLFFIKGRLLEGYYQAGAAARLAVGLGLHQISYSEVPSSSRAKSPISILGSSAPNCAEVSQAILPPPTSSIELGERILTFWQVFNLDRCWAVATGMAVALSDDNHPKTRIETVWPQALEDYEEGHSEEDHARLFQQSFEVMTPPRSGRHPTNALRAKATTLFERAARLSLHFGTTVYTLATHEFWVEFQTVDAAIQQLSAIVPLPHVPCDDVEQNSNQEAIPHATPRMDISLFVVHSLLHAATIQLHSPFTFQDKESQQKTDAVVAIATEMIHMLNEKDYPFLDPIMGTCWTSVAVALVRDLIMIKDVPEMEEHMSTLNRQLDEVVFAMKHLGITVPLVAYQAGRIEESRPILPTTCFLPIVGDS